MKINGRETEECSVFNYFKGLSYSRIIRESTEFAREVLLVLEMMYKKILNRKIIIWLNF